MSPDPGPALKLGVISVHASPLASPGSEKNGGLNVYVEEICRELSAQGVVTEVVTRCQDSPCRLSHLAEHSMVYELSCGPSGAGPLDLVEHLPAFADAVAPMAESHGWDLAWSHYWLSGLVARDLRARTGLPWIHTFHTIGAVKNQHLPEGDSPEPEVRLEAERMIAKEADLLVVHTTAEAEDVVRLLGADPARVAVVAAGVDLSLFSPLPRLQARLRLSLEADRGIVVFVGRLERLKGVELLIRALGHLEGSPGPRLIVIGEESVRGDGELARLQSVVGALGLGDQVEFRGRVPHRELPWYYSAADVCAMPSHSESFGLVALEAQACGCPVVATRVGGLETTVPEGIGGHTVEGRDPQAWASALARILDDPRHRESLGVSGRSHATGFTWSATARALVPHLEALVGGRRLRAIS